MTACLLTGAINSLKFANAAKKPSCLIELLLLRMFKILLLVSTTVICITATGSNLGIARTQNIQADARHQGGSPSSSTDSHHKMMEIPAGQPIPSVKLIVHKDAMKGYNLETKVSNFKFAPEDVNTAAKRGEGHAHLYINGEKITRLYGSWYYLENLQPGKNKITVSLNANSHETLAHNGTMIQDTKIVEVPAVSN